MSLKETKKRMMADPTTAQSIRDEVANAHRSVALAELRSGVVTQEEVAQILGVSQRRVSAIENASDVQISTLRSYLRSLGYSLELVATNESGEHIPLSLERPVV